MPKKTTDEKELKKLEEKIRTAELIFDGIDLTYQAIKLQRAAQREKIDRLEDHHNQLFLKIKNNKN